MNTQVLYTFIRKPFFAGVLVFVVMLGLTQLLSYQRYLLFKSSQQRELNNAAVAAKEKIQEVLSNGLSATRTLKFYVNEYGVPEDFEKIGKEIIETNRHIDAIELVKGTTITHIYPLKGNESVIGYKLLLDTTRNKEAVKTVLKDELFFAGPFELRQGGLGIVGRLPIRNNGKFWGFSAVVIRLPTLIRAAGIDTSDNEDYVFQLSKFNPDSKKEEFFLPNAAQFKGSASVSIDVPNGDWRLYVMPRSTQLIITPIPFSILGFLLSILGGVFAWFITQQPYQLKTLVEQQTKILAERESNYRDTIERVSDAFIALDKNWNYTYVNSKAGELHGKSPEYLLGKNMWDEFPDVVNEPFYFALHRAMETQEPQMLELYYSTLDKWFEDFIYPSKNGVTVYYRDVTKQRKYTEEITRERMLSESILKSLPGILYLYDENGKFIKWNKNFESVSGYTGEEIANMHPLDFFDEDEKELLTQRIGGVFTKGADEVEANFFTKDKRKIPYYFNGYLAYFEGKRCLIGVGIDVTTRKLAEREMQVSNERFEMVSKATNDVIWDWDLNTNYIWWNENYYNYFGYPYKDRLYKIEESWDIHIHPEDKERVVKGIHRAIEKGSYYWTDEYRFLKSDGSVLYIYDRGYMVYDADNKPARMVGAMQDITRQKNAEQDIRNSQAALRLLSDHLQTVREEERTSIAREIHDELGQQLTCLKMDASWLNKKVDKTAPDLTERIDGMISMIDDTVKTVRRIAADLRPGILDDLGLISALEWQTKEFEKRTGIKAEFKSELTEVDIDKKSATGLFRVYQEALTNVARHSKANGVESVAAISDNTLILHIHDNGVGFNLAEAKEKNTLGLLGMRERVLMFGGEIDFDSSAGKGTTIVIKAPLKAKV